MLSLLRRNTAQTEAKTVDGSSVWDLPADPDTATADALEKGAASNLCGSGPACRRSCSGGGVPQRREHQPDDDDDHDHDDRHHDEIYFRPLRETDRDSIKALHEEWFPVRYKEDFYDNVVRNRMAGSGDPLFSCVACVGGRGGGGGGGGGLNDKRRRIEHGAEDEMDDMKDWDQVAESLGIDFGTDEEEDGAGCMVTGTNGGDSMAIHRLDDDDDFVDDERGETSSLPANQNSPDACGEKMVGCIVGAFLDTSRCNKKSAELLVPDPERYGKVFYIMTLGSITAYRHRGLATRLVEECIRVVERERSCGALYLHVITYNEAAIRFYEKLGFARVEEIQDYYSIEDKHYNCYLYARYFHGNRGHFTLYYVVTNLISAVLRRVSAALKSEKHVISNGNISGTSSNT